MNEEEKVDEKIKNLLVRLGDFPVQSENYFKIATTHTSEDGRIGYNYEQLEFLGDSVLSIIVAEFLLKNYPLKPEGDLSKMRAYIVSRTQLNEVAKELHLKDYIHHQIDEKHLSQSKDIGGDVVEAVIGAFYLDSGIAAAKRFVYKWILNDKRIQNIQIKSVDPKSKLLEWAQQKKRSIEFLQLRPNIANPKSFEVQVWMDKKLYGMGAGNNKKTAEKNAAIATLKLLDPNA